VRIMEKFFIGEACGSQRSALRRLGYPYVMINYATKTNKPWQGIKELFVDCGGYSFFYKTGEYTTSDGHYIGYVLKWKPAYFALRDYPCEPELLARWGRTVVEHQQRTLEKHLRLLELVDERGVWRYSEPVAVLQGWTLEDYLRCYDMMAAHGVLTRIRYVAIGTLCRRGQEATIRKIITGIRRSLPKKYKLHGFGIKISSLRYKDVYDALYSADSCAWGLKERKNGCSTVKGQYELLLEFVAKLEKIKRIHEGQTLLEAR